MANVNNLPKTTNISVSIRFNNTGISKEVNLGGVILGSNDKFNDGKDNDGDVEMFESCILPNVKIELQRPPNDYVQDTPPKTTNDDNDICRICMDRCITTMFLPCTHYVTCKSCATVIDSCPICRSLIQFQVQPKKV
ncbi:hypothetical protein PvNV_090 [Penaeus vannamei nudivirus]|nr:e3 ubiquitin-protein ligase XIAP [Penaeus vannamei nucleopolyhedrovirus]